MKELEREVAQDLLLAMRVRDVLRGTHHLTPGDDDALKRALEKAELAVALALADYVEGAS